MARQNDGRFLLRIEDIDQMRCTPDLEAAVYRDLEWLELDWEMPVRRQSNHFPIYQSALQSLIDKSLAYPAFMTRGEVKNRVAAHEAKGQAWPRDPDGSPQYPGDDKRLSCDEREARLNQHASYAWRLDMQMAVAQLKQPLSWTETGDGLEKSVSADPAAWGDVILSRSDAPSSYHLSVVVDDALQDVTHVVRGRDLFHATSVHRLLQELLELPAPIYHHHRLILGHDGRKLSKSEGSTGLAVLRDKGCTPGDIRRMVGL
jgi:glutamyl-Q tRNA(Asp) synthetase